jgi:hypothetical protein
MIRPSRALFGAALLVAARPALAVEYRAGKVVYATASHLYLDAGSRDGLAPGQVLTLHRGDRVSSTCKVEQVADAQATCTGAGRPGDTFSLVPPPPLPPVKRPAPPPQPAVLEQRRTALAGAPFEKVDFHGGPGVLAAPTTRVEVALGHASWASIGAGPWQQERLDVALRGTAIGGGFSLDVAVSARRWSRRSDPISFRPDDPTQLYVWEAAISRRSADGGPALSVGRVRPWFTPGQVALDGAQVGWRTSGGNEAGVFGGAVPDAVTLAPSLSQGTFGAYWAGQHTGAPDSVLRFFRHEARVALVNTAELGQRVEGEGLLEARITKRMDLSVDARFGRAAPRASSGYQAPNSLDAVRVDGGIRPFDTFSLNGSFRYEGLSVPELDGPGHVMRGGQARHADLAAAWEPVSFVRVSVSSGLSTDLVTHQTRQWIGPELGFPVLFAGRVNVSAGYFEEGGWAPGRSAWLQLLTGSQGTFRLLLRGSWFRTRGIAPGDLDELGASAAIEAQLSALVALRISALGRTTLNGATTPFASGTGQAGVVDASLAGRF